MSFFRTLASPPLEILLTACLVACALVSVRTLRRAYRVLRSVRTRPGEPAAEMWALTQVRIEWCILIVQLDVLARSLLLCPCSLLDVLAAALLAAAVLMNQRTCDRLQSLPPSRNP